ncbi:MAG: acyltransferase [Clostridia bacterium]|nr:acyltransferase [Clostridia bacterium]
MNKRLNYIDNMRTLTVSLLIIYHLAMAYNTWGEANYIFFNENKILSLIVVLISPWFMPLMFLLAGIGAYYSLKKRSVSVFIKERLVRLGIPLVFGLAVLNPILSYIADVTHNDYSGSILSHYSVYFTRFTDLSGYDGGFTLGHLWFIAVLIVISILSCLFIKLFSKMKSNKCKNILYCFLAIIAVATFDIKPLGKPIITYLCVFLLGYCLFSNQEFICKLAKYKWLFVIAFITADITNAILFIFVGRFEVLNNICNYSAFALGIPALFCLGNDCLDFADSISMRCSRLSYVFYIVHFPVVVLCQYFISLTGIGTTANFFVSFVASSVITCLLCLAIDTNSVTKLLFGLKK